MATTITSECINCGACEPECPNNAISQGETIYVIDPLLCTECVGFHDYEACAAVCPVDCCVTDPNNIETEEVLIARARALHKEIDFGENFPSRFRKAAGTESQAPARTAEPTRAAMPMAETKLAPAPSAEATVAPVETKSPSREAVVTAPPASTPAAKPAPAVTPPPRQKEVKPKKTFPQELPLSFEEISNKFRGCGALSQTSTRLLIALLQPLLGALPHRAKKNLEDAVQNPVIFSAAGSTALNVLHNIVLYPLVAIAAAVALNGTGIIFSREINIYVICGILVGVVEGALRLRDGIFRAKPASEMAFPAAFYGVPLALLLAPVLGRRSGVVRDVPIPVDGFYAKGFVEKLERERRYGNVYTLEDRGGALLLRLEFPRRVPDLGIPERARVPDEMPDYDYDLILKDGHFIVKGRCTEELVRKISSSVGAFPPEFTTVIPLPAKISGFVHRYDNKLLEVFLVKDSGSNGAAAYPTT